jgi:hypothetical protein
MEENKLGGLMACPHERVVRLVVSDADHWLCTWCNEQFIPKSAVDYKLCHLTTELAKRLVDEQASGVWREEGV